jgi:uncharacterized protein YcnI
MNKKFIVGALITAGFLISQTVSAHVTVKPNQAGIATFQSFSVGVPVEKDIPTVGLRLVVPAGLEYVTPNVKPGWRIAVKKDGTGEDAKVTEITWTGGTIPAGQRDEFAFSAKTPATPTAINWKAYQTYRDGTVVAWDQDGATIDETAENVGPYSTTAIIDDLAVEKPKDNSKTAFILSVIALGVSSGTMASVRRIRKTDSK